MIDLETEKQLVTAAKVDQSKFTALFDLYHINILKYAINRTGDVQAANDITQVTFIKAMEKIKSFEFRGTRFSSWLFTIATNEINNFFRDTPLLSLEEIMENENFNPRAVGDPSTEIISAEEEVERAGMCSAVRLALKELPEKYQEVIALKYFGEKTFLEISEILNKPDSTVKSLFYKGLKKLKKIFESKETEKLYTVSVLNAQIIKTI